MVHSFGQISEGIFYSLLDLYDAVVGLVRTVFKKCGTSDATLKGSKWKKVNGKSSAEPGWPMTGANTRIPR